jgi:MFS family permease
MYDGAFANMFATLTGGVFLTGYAMQLGMNEIMIGFLGAIPFLVTVFQLPTSYVIGRTGKRKQVAFSAAGIARGLWIPITVVAFMPRLSVSIKSLTVLGLIFLSHIFVSVSYVSWLSWTSDLVPEHIRGRFFGARNMLNGAAGMAAMVVFGYLLDYLSRGGGGGAPAGFAVTFVSAVVFGGVSLFFLRQITEPPAITQIARYSSLARHFRPPFEDDNFRRFLIFAMLWSFSVHFASPFFSLYFLRDLKFSYGFVAILGMVSAFADLIGMRIWGRVSDRVKNKAVIRLASWVAAFLPLAWVTVRPDNVVWPMIIHIVGGGFWAGITLCMNNMLLQISPREGRSSFLSIYHIAAGVGAASAPILSGFLVRNLAGVELEIFSWKLDPLQGVFLTSTVLRLLSLQFFKYVHEPEEMTVGQMFRIIRSVRGLNMATGFNYLLHPFVDFTGEKRQT